MLHLIWTKDEASPSAAAAAAGDGAAGDEEKEATRGIRARLIECYTQLYFEPPADMTEKDQVAFVARNVIECVTPFPSAPFRLIRELD